MASPKRLALPTQGGESTWDSSRFTSETAWHKYQHNVHLRNILPDRNIELSASMFDEFYGDLQRRQWHWVLTKLPEKQINIALVKEFYSNIYEPEYDTPKYYKVQGHVIRFDAETINDFLDTPITLVDREEYPTYSQYLPSW